MQIIKRKEAKEKGLKRYFTGKPCKHGHVVERLVYGGCIECRRLWTKHQNKSYHREYYHKRRALMTTAELDEFRKRQRKYNNTYYQNNKEKMKKRSNDYRQKEGNPEKRKQYNRAWREKNKEHCKHYAEKNRARYAAHCNERRARRLQARPVWVDNDVMKSLYKISRTVTAKTGVQHHVDHYYPLTHEQICGLDVPWNLQIITAKENAAKGNKMPEEFYGANHTMIPVPACTMSQS